MSLPTYHPLPRSTTRILGRIVQLAFRQPGLRPKSSPVPRFHYPRDHFFFACPLTTVTHASEYEWIDDTERLENYIKGGYHPVRIGDVLHGRYRVVDKLGYGGWSTVWLARDSHLEQYVAVKVGVADSLPHEVKVLRALEYGPAATKTAVDAGSKAIPRVLDEFRVQGPNGSHPCYTTAPALCSLQESSFCRLFPPDVARAIAYELALAVAFVHSRGYAHGDIHLGNVLVRAPISLDELSVEQFRQEYGEPLSYLVKRLNGNALPPGVPSAAVVPLSMGKKAHEFTLDDAHILLGDFGESFAPATERRLGRDCHTPIDFRPPEASFEPDAPLSFSADVWSLATAIWDILGMQALYSSAFYSEEEVMCQVVDTMGPLPARWHGKWKDCGEFFDDSGVPKSGRTVWPKLPEAFEEQVQQFRREDGMGEFGSDEMTSILDMIGSMLRYLPEERPTAAQVLESEWMVRWARRDYNHALGKKNI